MAFDTTMNREELELAKFILGPWLIGSFLEVALQGILFCQFDHYFAWHRKDDRGIRLAVVVLAVLTTLKSVQTIVSCWNFFILHFEDLTGALMLNYTAWWQSGSALMVATIGLYVQGFFCHRLWGISKHNPWIVASIALVLTFAYVAVCFATYYISRGVDATAKISLWFAVHLSCVFAGDILIMFSTAYFLLKSRKDALPQTAGVIDALVRLTFQTAAPAAICAMFNLIFSQIWSGKFRLISLAFNQALPKLYAISMMWTLNARRRIRANDRDIVFSAGADIQERRRTRTGNNISTDGRTSLALSHETRIDFSHSLALGSLTSSQGTTSTKSMSEPKPLV